MMQSLCSPSEVYSCVLASSCSLYSAVGWWTVCCGAKLSPAWFAISCLPCGSAISGGGQALSVLPRAAVLGGGCIGGGADARGPGVEAGCSRCIEFCSAGVVVLR
eukprot:2407702-Amphidinium_carterae.1